MAARIKITIKNRSENESPWKYRIFSKLPEILYDNNSTVGIRDIFWPCCYVTDPIQHEGKDSFEYTAQYYGFIGKLRRGKKNIKLTRWVEVTLGTSGDDGPCMIAGIDEQGALTIKSSPNIGDHKAPKGAFQIHCRSGTDDKDVVVGLARHFEPDEEGSEPCPVVAVQFKRMRRYTIKPSPVMCVTTNGGEKGDILQNPQNPQNSQNPHGLFEVESANPKSETVVINDTSGGFSYKSGKQQSNTSNSFGAGNGFNDPSTASRDPKPKDPSSQNPEKKASFQPQLPPGAKARGFQTLEQFFAYNFLSRFNKTKLKYYTDQDLVDIAKKTDVWFEQIRKVDELGADVLSSLLLLSLYDCVLLLDDSGSMNWGQGKDGRKDHMRYICKRLIDVDTIFVNVDNTFTDAKGVQVEFINSRASKWVRTPAEFQAHFDTIRFNGGTNLGGALYSKILKPRVYDVKNADGRRKPLLISIITDGEPGPERRDQLKIEVKRCKEFLKKETHLGDKTVVFQISKVGSELAAEEFINEIENDSDLTEIVDCTSYLDIDPPPDHKPKIEKHAAAIKLLAGALLVNFEQYQDDDWKEVNIE